MFTKTAVVLLLSNAIYIQCFPPPLTTKNDHSEELSQGKETEQTVLKKQDHLNVDHDQQVQNQLTSHIQSLLKPTPASYRAIPPDLDVSTVNVPDNKSEVETMQSRNPRRRRSKVGPANAEPDAGRATSQRGPDEHISKSIRDTEISRPQPREEELSSGTYTDLNNVLGEDIIDVDTDNDDPDDVTPNREQETTPNTNYNFRYEIEDGINGGYNAKEEQRENGKVTGFYKYDDGNIFRTVTYEADENGFRVLSDIIEPSRKVELTGKAKVGITTNGTTTQYEINHHEAGGQRLSLEHQKSEEVEN